MNHWLLDNSCNIMMLAVAANAETVAGAAVVDVATVVVGCCCC